MIYDLQKASTFKRVSALLFDVIILATLAVGIAALLSWCFGYDAKLDHMETIYERYEKIYDIDLDISAEEFEKLDEDTKTRYDEANKVFGKDPEVILLNEVLFTLSIAILISSILVAYLILEFTVPLIFKNGQTFGKKIFGVGVMCDNGVKISPFVLFVRTILGKYTIETMVPIFILYLIFMGDAGIIGIAALLLFVVFQIGLIIKTKTNSAIHDVLAYTVAVDLESQMIFDTKEALMEYKNKVHAEDAEKKPY